MVVWPLCGFCVLDPVGWFSIQDSNQRLWMDFEEGVASLELEAHHLLREQTLFPRAALCLCSLRMSDWFEPKRIRHERTKIQHEKMINQHEIMENRHEQMKYWHEHQHTSAFDGFLMNQKFLHRP